MVVDARHLFEKRRQVAELEREGPEPKVDVDGLLPWQRDIYESLKLDHGFKIDKYEPTNE